jgi:hypothetical protein
MSNPKMAEVTLVEGGGVFTDDDGQTHFIKGYGFGRGKQELDLDPRIDLTAPIWEQVQKLREQDAAAENKA